jgi:predicted nucleic acid-binding Zn ribbon protein
MKKETSQKNNSLDDKKCLCCGKLIPEQFSQFCNSCSVYNNERQKIKENKLGKFRRIIKNQQDTIIELLVKNKKLEEKVGQEKQEDKLHSQNL